MLPLAFALLVAVQSSSPERSVWSLAVNGIDRGDVVAVISDAEVWLPVEALASAGVTGFAGVQEDRFGERHVLLNSLAPSVGFELDTNDIRLLITAAPALFSSRTYSVLPDRPPGLVYRRSFSAALNYAAHWDRAAEGIAVAGELAISAGPGVFLSGLIAQPDGRILRGLSSVTVDQPSGRRRWIVGDTFGPATELGSRPLVLGASVASEYSLDPYYHRFARPVISGAATLPSRADVYIDGQLVRQLTVPPGPFRVDRLPVTTGVGRVSVVVRDPFGRSQDFGGPFYLAQTALARGQQEYGYSAGLRRQDQSDGTVVYKDFVGSGLHRFGITDALTVGFQGEGGEGLGVAGPSVNVKIWRAGEVGWSGLFSKQQTAMGQAHSAIYLFSARRLSAYAVGAYYSERFASLDRPEPLPSDWFGRFDVSATIGRRLHVGAGAFRDRQQFIGLALAPEAGYSFARLAATSFGNLRAIFPSFPSLGASAVSLTRTRGYTATANIQAHSRLHLTATVRRVEDESEARPQWQGFAGATVVFGGRIIASVQGSRETDVNGLAAAVDRSLPVGTGYGFRTSVDTASDQASVEVQGQNPFGYAAVRFHRLNGVDSTELDVAGGVAAIGRRLLLSRPLNASFALVQVPASRGVRVSVNNQQVGRTNRWGDLLVPDLIPYVDNRLSIADQDVPLDFEIKKSSDQLAPPYRGGAVVVFPVAPIRTFNGRIVVVTSTGEATPSYGTLTVTFQNRVVESPLSGDGEFYLENLTIGRYPASVTFEGGRCTFDLDVPRALSLMTDLGVLRCAAAGS